MNWWILFLAWFLGIDLQAFLAYARSVFGG